MASKTQLYYVVQGQYGYGWEDVTAEESLKEGNARLKEYQENEPMTAHRIIRRGEFIIN